ncbi:MAG: hypothetical protein QOK02_6793 [Mycobacterium sp.]|nr:hypothetical protein [Mycobacterium sp.]
MISPPIIVATGDDCAFYRDVADAIRSRPSPDSRVFDSVGTRLVVGDDGLRVHPDAEGADELSGLLRAWLGGMDALRESTANWSLALLVQASVDHLGYTP